MLFSIDHWPVLPTLKCKNNTLKLDCFQIKDVDEDARHITAMINLLARGKYDFFVGLHTFKYHATFKLY